MKIKNNIPKDSQCDLMKTYTDGALIAYLQKQDIEFVEGNDYDFVFEDANRLVDEGCTVMPRTIAFERIDGCQIRNRALLKDPNLHKLVKMYVYGDFEINNAKTMDNRIFPRQLTFEYNLNKEVLPITKEEFDKIDLGFSFWHYLKHDFLENHIEEADLTKNRSISVSFLGTTEYGDASHESGKLISKHRQGCVEAINCLSIANTQTSPNRSMQYYDYLDLLLNSKIVVSPWGWGEACYREYEAIACGCEVIKPMTKVQIQSNPSIYNNTYMHFCKPDWSDLESVVYDILDNWIHGEPLRLMRHTELIMSRTYKRKIKIMKQILDYEN